MVKELNLRMVLLSYKDKNSLPPSITDIVMYEYLTPIVKNDLTMFFIGLYEERKCYKQVGYEPKEVEPHYPVTKHKTPLRRRTLGRLPIGGTDSGCFFGRPRLFGGTHRGGAI